MQIHTHEKFIVINLKGKDQIAAVAKVPTSSDEDDELIVSEEGSNSEREASESKDVEGEETTEE